MMTAAQTLGVSFTVHNLHDSCLLETLKIHTRACCVMGVWAGPRRIHMLGCSLRDSSSQQGSAKRFKTRLGP